MIFHPPPFGKIKNCQTKVEIFKVWLMESFLCNAHFNFKLLNSFHCSANPPFFLLALLSSYYISELIPFHFQRQGSYIKRDDCREVVGVSLVHMHTSSACEDAVSRISLKM